jgi:hypothetical protein
MRSRRRPVYAFADPCQYDHYERDLAQSNDARLIAQTPIGEYTLDNIRLNREELLAFAAASLRSWAGSRCADNY